MSSRDHHDDLRRLGVNIAFYRKLRNLSQIQLAEAVDVSRTHMSRIENADSSVSLEVLFRIADVLNIPVYKLFMFDQ